MLVPPPLLALRNSTAIMELARHLHLRSHVCLHRRTVVIPPPANSEHRLCWHLQYKFLLFLHGAESPFHGATSSIPNSGFGATLWMTPLPSPPHRARSDNLSSEHAQVFVVGARLKNDAGCGGRKCREAVGQRRRRDTCCDVREWGRYRGGRGSDLSRPNKKWRKRCRRSKGKVDSFWARATLTLLQVCLHLH